MRGYVYVLTNQAMPNLVKVGFTTRSVTERIDELSSTGVPTRYTVVFYCEVEDPEKLESLLHKKLRTNHYGKEFFQIKVEAVVRIFKESILENEIVCYGFHGAKKDAYLTSSEQEQFEIQRKLLEAKSKEQTQKEILRKTLALEHKAKLKELLPSANNIIRKYQSWNFSENSLNSLIGMLLYLALIISVIGLLFIDKVFPPTSTEGENIAERLDNSEIRFMKALKQLILTMQLENTFEEVASDFFEREKPNCLLFKRKENYRSDTANGWFETSTILNSIFQKID